MMGFETVYRCTICGCLNVFYDMGQKDDGKIGDVLYNYCKNDCVYSEDEHCKIKGKSKLVRVL